MSTPSIENQIVHALDSLFWDKAKIDAYKTEHNVRSVKKALRLPAAWMTWTISKAA